jgi:type III secretion system FlhB-like substrate exporter
MNICENFINFFPKRNSSNLLQDRSDKVIYSTTDITVAMAVATLPLLNTLSRRHFDIHVPSHLYVVVIEIAMYL